MVNLLRLLRGDLRGMDLSHLSIRQAYLAEVEAQDASLAGAHLAAGGRPHAAAGGAGAQRRGGGPKGGEAEQLLMDAYCEAFAGTSGEIDDVRAIDLEFGTGAAPAIPFIQQFPPTLGRGRGAAR